MLVAPTCRYQYIITASRWHDANPERLGPLLVIVEYSRFIQVCCKLGRLSKYINKRSSHAERKSWSETQQKRTWAPSGNSAFLAAGSRWSSEYDWTICCIIFFLSEERRADIFLTFGGFLNMWIWCSLYFLILIALDWGKAAQAKKDQQSLKPIKMV